MTSNPKVPTEENFLSQFQVMIELKEELQRKQEEINLLKEQSFANKQVNDLFQRLSFANEYLKERALPDLASPLMAIDRFGLYRHLEEVLYLLLERLLADEYGEPPVLPPEIRAVQFLYLLTRFVETNHRYPRAEEQVPLFRGISDVVLSLESLLAKSEDASPLVRAFRKQQKASAQRGCVGCDSNEFVEEKPLGKYNRNNIEKISDSQKLPKPKSKKSKKE